MHVSVLFYTKVYLNYAKNAHARHFCFYMRLGLCRNSIDFDFSHLENLLRVAKLSETDHLIFEKSGLLSGWHWLMAILCFSNQGWVLLNWIFLEVWVAWRVTESLASLAFSLKLCAEQTQSYPCSFDSIRLCVSTSWRESVYHWRFLAVNQANILASKWRCWWLASRSMSVAP